MTRSADGPIIAVASTFERAERIAGDVARAKVQVWATSDLGWAIAEQPSVLFIDPAGWEGTCRSLLAGFPERPAVPPAVYLVASDDLALFEAGPALDLAPEPLEPRETRSRIDRAIVLRRTFARHWPRMLNIKRAFELGRVEEILASRSGLEIRDDRVEDFHEAVTARMVATLSPTVRDYERLLTSSPQRKEILLLSSRIVVGETHFWRYSGQMQVLRSLASRLPAEGDPPAPLRVWCAGCSTGEEPYSVAMALADALEGKRDFEVRATDINPVFLSFAKRGRYSERSLRNLPPQHKLKWLSPDGGGYLIADELREKIRFERLNLVSEEAAAWAEQNGPFDVIFCRNVTIYFSLRKTDQAVALLIEALRMGGVLFLGSAETLYPLPPKLGVVHEPGVFYFVRRDLQPEPLDQPSAESPQAGDAETLAAFHAGLDALGREDFDAAEEQFRTLLDADPESPLGNTGVAILLANQGREIEARERLAAVIETGRAPVEAHFMAGLLEERAARPEEALVEYARVLEHDERFLMAHFNRAWIFRRMGRETDFKAEMRRALSLLKFSPHCPAWVTGGLSFESLVALVAEAVDGVSEP